jgi:sulfur relay protein TusB/DsrH
MTSLLLVLSKDPYSTEIPDLVLDIGLDAKAKGNDVCLYLIEDGVTASRSGGYSDRIAEVQSKGVKVYADDKSIAARGLEGKIISSVQVSDIEVLFDFIMDYDRIAWF